MLNCRLPKSECRNVTSRAMMMVIVVALAVLTAEYAWGKVAVVWIQNRVDPLRGELVNETADTLTLSIAGINTTLNKKQIVRIEFELTLEEEYQQKKAEVADDDYEGRYELARWLYDQGTAAADELATGELTDLLEESPGHERAGLLLNLVKQRQATREEAESVTQRQGPVTPEVRRPLIRGQETGEHLLSEEQRNILKVYELNLEVKPRLQIDDEVLDEFLDKYRAELALADYQEREGRARFKRLAGFEQLRIMFDSKARDFYGRVIVRDEPEPLQFFRTRANSLYVVGYFIQQFGTEPVPGMKLTTVSPQTEATAYTNFLMLHLGRTGEGMRFIDRDKAEESLLLQWGLPRESAKYPAPDVPGWKQFFNGVEDPRYKLYVDWIKRLYYPTPAYPIEYSPTAAPDQEQAEGEEVMEDEDQAEDEDYSEDEDQ